MDCWEDLYIQVFCQKKVLIDKQQVSDTNPLFELVNIPYTPWLESYPFQHTSPYRTPCTHTHQTVSTLQYWYWFYKNYSIIKTIPLLPSILIIIISKIYLQLCCRITTNNLHNFKKLIKIFKFSDFNKEPTSFLKMIWMMVETCWSIFKCFNTDILD